MQLPHAVTLPRPGEPEKPDALQELAKSIAKGADNPPLNLPNLNLPPNTRPAQKQPLYDPMFNAESQPGFKTHEQKTKQTGKFSFGRRPTLDVEATPMGTYQAIVYRAIGEQWYRQCDLNRDLIVTGTVRIRILINKNGKVSSMRQTSRVGASEVQKSFTFLALNSPGCRDAAGGEERARRGFAGNVLRLQFLTTYHPTTTSFTDTSP